MSKNLKIVLYLVERQTNPHIDVLYATIISKSVAADCVCDRELKKLLRTTLPPPPQIVSYLSYPFWSSKGIAIAQVFTMQKWLLISFPAPSGPENNIPNSPFQRTVSSSHGDRRPAVCAFRTRNALPNRNDGITTEVYRSGVSTYFFIFF